MGNPDSKYFQIAIYGLGILAIASTYLPTPLDNITYLFISLFVGCLIYAVVDFQKKSQEYRKQSYAKAASISTRVNIIILMLILAALTIKFILGYV